MKLRRPTRVASAAALASALLLGACTGGSSDPGPTATTPPSTSATSQPSASTTPPPTSSTKTTPAVDPVLAKIPKAARPETMEGASQYVRFYFEALSDAAMEADPSLFSVLASQSCSTCLILVKSIEDLKNKSQRFEGPSLTVKYTTASVFNATERKILAKIDQKPVRVIDANGNKVRTTSGEPVSFLATLQFRSGRWIIERLQSVK